MPRSITSFIGRSEEIRRLQALVTNPDLQLVNVTGPGGIGKTRLALEVGRQVGLHFRDGIFFVGLADVRDPHLVPGAIARVLGIHHAVDATLKDRIRHAYGDSRLLVIVDNLEHLLESVPDLTSILAMCPGITLLTTSRRRLGVSGEQVFEVPPLPLHHAVDLFEQRARSIAPDFVSTRDSRGAMVDICSQLDCLPLAIELAAARILVLPPTAMLALMDDRLSLLSEGMRDAPVRHRGIREAIDWSYHLLSQPERDLFHRLSVFEGGFTMEGARAIAELGAPTLHIMSTLESSSFIRPQTNSSGNHRFFILQTLREYGLERLRSEGDEAATRQAHASFVHRLCTDTERVWWNSGGLDKLDLLEPEIPNIRVALTWLQEEGQVSQLLHLAGSLAPMWASRGYSVEGRNWLEWGLPRSDDSCRPYLAVALRALSWILNQHGEMYRSLVIAQHAVHVSEEAGDDRNLTASMLLSGLAANRVDPSGWAVQLFDQARVVLERCADEPWAPVTNCIRLNLHGTTLLERGNLDDASSCWIQMLELQQELDLRFTPAGHIWKGLGFVAQARGQFREALRHHATALDYSRQVRDVRQCAVAVGGAAGAAAALGHYEEAGRLFGAAEAMHERISYLFVTETFAVQRALGLPEPWTSMYPECHVADGLRQSLLSRTATLRAVHLDPIAARAWWEEGRRLDLEAVANLIADLEQALRREPEHPGGLSPREMDVLRLVAQGLTDREIATTLFISIRTVQNHVQHIYQKISVSSRAGATGWAIRHGLG